MGKMAFLMKVIELFAGTGGLALGFERAGLESTLLIELDKDAVSTLRTNRPTWNILHNDVKDVSYHGYEADIVAGGFPCQAFSYAGQGRGFEDTRGTLFFEFARCIKEVSPKIAVAENVRGLVNHDEGRTLETMLNTLVELGYKPYYEVLNSQYYDVPQKRERIFIVGIRNDLNITMKFPEKRSYIPTLRDVIWDCPISEGIKYSYKKKKVLELVPPGGYWRDLPLDIQAEYMGKSLFLGGGKTGMARRLSWDAPSLTLTCNPAQKQTERCHPEETRPLTVREYARIQTFPDDWEFSGSIYSKYKQIGNAVPVNLAYHVGLSLVSMLESEVI
jgi:DNA (cytosine-5)-methyltransferase 1